MKLNYELMNRVSDGLIVEQFDKKEVLFLNNSVKNLLKVPENKEITSLKEILRNDEVYNILCDNTEKDFKEEGYSIAKVYFKAFDNSYIEVLFHCGWFDEENKIVTYSFQHTDCVIKEEELEEVQEYSACGLVYMNLEPELAVTHANKAYYKLLGVTEEDKVNKQMVDKNLSLENQNWVLAEIYDSAYNNTDLDIEFPVEIDGESNLLRFYGRKGQSTGWQKSFYVSLKDLVDKNEDNAYNLERILFRRMMELTNDTMFRIDLRTNVLNIFGSESKGYASKVTTLDNFPQSVIEANFVHEDDMPVFNELVENIRKGVLKTFELRFAMVDNKYEWQRIVYNFINDVNGKPLVVTGKLTNINAEKLREETVKSRHDDLTNLYNKNAIKDEFKNLISLDPDKGHTLLLIDIDNFSAINEHLGYHFGDMVLKEIAADINNCFREGDIVSRVGGDVFAVIMRNCSEHEIAMDRAKTVCACMKKTYSGSNDKRYSISASIAISSYPEDGRSYDEIAFKADMALDVAKESGKNGIVRYEDYETQAEILEERKEDKEVHRVSRRKVEYVDRSIVITVFNLLYETKDIQLSLKTVLEFLSNEFKVDRTYIFEPSKCSKHYNNNYQWAKGAGMQGVIAGGAELTIPGEIVKDIFSFQDEDGIVHTNDITMFKNPATVEALKGDGVVSALFIKSANAHERTTFFGVDDCKNKRIWTEEELRTLHQSARIIFAALMYYNKAKEFKEFKELKESKELKK